ncbi:hypothetical protein PDESU_03008 [Pontiella desulfatans]|uniref:SLA1 homology domain-containing protein n=1 Tax=Pontiella desulfatans TaxID=2750659 RepID=A0A6C2U4W9_PONDE|nr:SHD1 domain-containing protein [Pontiella desulfatans]VGO14446.1 hypothetical protein PDESU_03008 [Pontiella desulfatans]
MTTIKHAGWLGLAALVVLIPLHQVQAEMRVWTSTDGKTVEAEFVSVMGDKLVLKTEKGKTVKIPVAQMSPEDLEFIDLAKAPVFNITFTKQSGQRFVETGPYIENQDATIFDYVFGVKMKQTSARPYPHELQVEYFAIGAERKTYGDKFILLDRGSSSFTPSRANQLSHEFKGKKVEVMEYLYDDDYRGRKYNGYLVTVTDKRGIIIAHSETSKWLFENLENLKKLPVGAYFDKTCTRTHPTRPKSTRY